MPSREIQISFITLTWNSEQYIEGFMSSIEKISVNHSLELLVVDNGSTDTTLIKLRQQTEKRSFPIRLISLKKNFGTTVSRNLAIRKARGEIIIILDSDTEFDAMGFDNMIETFKNNPRIGILAPRLHLSDGAYQNSCKRFPTLQDKLLKTFGILLPFSVARSDFYKNFDFNSSQEVDTAISAFWVLSQEIFDEIGYLDENIFYAPEDIDFSLRVWLKGKKVFFFPGFKVVHHTQQITHKSPFNIITRSHIKGLFYYFKKHGYMFSYNKIRRMIDKIDLEKNA